MSTVPGTFKPLATEPSAVGQMAENYIHHAAHLVRLAERTGRDIALSIEPEPCCFLETINETVAFFEDHLFDRRAQSLLAAETGLPSGQCEAALRRHLGICYDVCHAAVEFEDPTGSIRQLADAGIAITKLQLSAAMRVPEVSPATEDLLRPFDEGVYLHQTVEKRGDSLTRHVDLQDAFAALRAGDAGGEWRVHCHVPVFLPNLGRLASTQDFLVEVLAICRAQCVSPHLEVETYTWDVLPDHLRGTDKAQAIARELAWVQEQLAV